MSYKQAKKTITKYMFYTFNATYVYINIAIYKHRLIIKNERHKKKTGK